MIGANDTLGAIRARIGEDPERAALDFVADVWRERRDDALGELAQRKGEIIAALGEIDRLHREAGTFGARNPIAVYGSRARRALQLVVTAGDTLAASIRSGAISRL